MTNKKDSITILMADDDDDDFLLTKKALEESKLANTLVRVGDGEELLDYLYSRGAYESAPTERPGMILLDLNMPRKEPIPTSGIFRSSFLRPQRPKRTFTGHTNLVATLLSRSP